MTNNNPTVFEVEKFSSFTDETLHTKDFRILNVEGDLWTVILKNKKYLARVKDYQPKTKTYTINVSGFDFNVKVQEGIDRLIHDLGFLTSQKHSVKEIKSPMPGLVVNIFVEEGQEVIAFTFHGKAAVRCPVPQPDAPSSRRAFSWALGGAVQSEKILPGFMMFFGSSARLMLRIISTAPAPVSVTRKSILCRPMPCSPVQVPSRLSARLTSWWLSASATRRSSALSGSIR